MMHDYSQSGVIVVGPTGCGKTHNRRAIAEAFKIASIFDNWDEGDKFVPGALHLTTYCSPERAQRVGAPVVTFEDAMKLAGLSPHIHPMQRPVISLAEAQRIREAIKATRTMPESRQRYVRQGIALLLLAFHGKGEDEDVHDLAIAVGGALSIQEWQKASDCWRDHQRLERLPKLVESSCR